MTASVSHRQLETRQRKVLALSAFYKADPNCPEASRLVVALGVMNRKAGSSVILWKAKPLSTLFSFRLAGSMSVEEYFIDVPSVLGAPAVKANSRVVSLSLSGLLLR